MKKSYEDLVRQIHEDEYLVKPNNSEPLLGPDSPVNKRCVVCNSVQNQDIETNPGEFSSNLKFYKMSVPESFLEDDICEDCVDSIISCSENDNER